jgi:hypothetical protein
MKIDGKLYGLHEVNGELRYIGLTSRRLERRLTEHLSEHAIRRRTPLARWMARHVARGTRPIVTVLARTDDSDALNRLEIEWIASAKAAAVQLLNLSSGGESGSLGVKRSPETIAKLKSIPRMPRSAEYRRRLGNANRGRKLDAGWRSKLSESRRGEANGRAKLTASNVTDIRLALDCGETCTKLAKHYGVTRPMIGHIKHGRYWK